MKNYLKHVLPQHILEADQLSENAKMVLAAIMVESIKFNFFNLEVPRTKCSDWVESFSHTCELDEKTVMDALMELSVYDLIFIDAHEEGEEEEPTSDPHWDIYPLIAKIKNPNYSLDEVNAFKNFYDNEQATE